MENVWKFIGFCNKGNAKRTLENNFEEGEDYKKSDNEFLLLRTEKQKSKDPRGGHNEETIMLNIDTFKNLCIIAKTENGKT